MAEIMATESSPPATAGDKPRGGPDRSSKSRKSKDDRPLIMVAFRFCRPDDIPFLVRAVNECFDVHFPGRPPLTLAEFQSDIRQLDVWASNCMVARQGEEPVGVLIAAKRDTQVLIQKIGVRPDWQRREIGAHLLTSLSQKLAVLGPPRLIAELPGDGEGLQAFFRKCGYREERRYHGYVLPEPLANPPPQEAVAPFTVQDAQSNDLLEDDPALPWHRQTPTLLARAPQIDGWALASPDRIEAFLLLRESEILRHGYADSPDYLDLLLRHASRTAPLRLLSRQPAPPLPAFQPEKTRLRLHADAQPI